MGSHSNKSKGARAERPRPPKGGASVINEELKQSIIIQLRLAPEVLIDTDYTKYCKYPYPDKKGRYCILRQNHTGLHLNVEGLYWGMKPDTVVIGNLHNILVWE